jgi:hypothetical protein
MQFGIRSLLVVMVVASLGVPAICIPGGSYYFLPLLWLFVLVLVFIAIVRKRSKSQRPLRLTKDYPLIGVGLVLLFSSVGFVMLADVAMERYATLRSTSEGRSRALAIKDPEHFRDVSLELRSRLMTLPVDQRVVSGQSPDLPREIRSLEPVRITANANYIDIQMTQDGGSLVAYPLDGTFPHVLSRRLAPCLYYWPE